jgi:ribosome maturation factor RimP
MNTVAHEKLEGLDRERVLAAVGPVLRAHGVDGVELIWRTDRSGWVLELTIEKADSRVPGEGVTLELCSDISRDLSAALDVSDIIPHRYRLEVGSPGLERALYGVRDYARFAGQLARIKLAQPQADGQRLLDGVLHGLDDLGAVSLETAKGLVSIELDKIESARLVFDMNAGRGEKGRPVSGKNAFRRASGRGR